MRKCINIKVFFSWKKHNCFDLSQKKGLQKKGGFSAFPSKLFVGKKLVSNNTYILEFLKIALPSIGSPNLQL